MKQALKPILRAIAVTGAAAALAACVYAPPPPPGYGYGYAPGYAYAGPPVVGSVDLGFGCCGYRHWH